MCIRKKTPWLGACSYASDQKRFVRTGMTKSERRTQICHSDMSALEYFTKASASAMAKTVATMGTAPLVVGDIIGFARDM